MACDYECAPHRGGWVAGVCATVMALGLVSGASAPAAAQEPSNHTQAIQGLRHADASHRLAAMARLADIGTAADANAVMPHLRDDSPAVRQFAMALVWRLWGRSGDPAVDALYEQGVALMRAGELTQAVRVFSDIIARRPAFAEAWNKRATLFFLLDQHELSMKDCDEVLQRIPLHFGALSGYAQMLAGRGQPERALQYLERAFQVNPDMPDAKLAIEHLRRQVEARRKKSV